MFCATLRKRPEWAAAVPILLRKETRDWKEKKLETHDVAMPMPAIGTIRGGGVFLRFILLSAPDLKQPETLQRIERLFYLEGGRRCAIVFLLSTDGNQDGLSAMGQLQMEIMEKFISIPILPLTSLDHLPARLEAFHGKLLTPNPCQARSVSAEAQTLLPYCSVNPPLPQQPTHVLSDINTSFSDLLDKVTTGQGQAILQDYAGDDVANRIIQFWTTEFS
ncbi:hypothetical protein CONLIGDRAFT_675742 [Coniochaeta ligniaria NRRL 30616]|uniref:Uncharacterized protein n=1 Tax=Coniochaeta ligniaria NRRL 30616 TaxID=1408157 RepID=A0A1J7K3N2_9PEZI|nr:hypothetical protein CONLIGDRAFT_675742 [Coniochaeta ligniaria NRRL 30616]